MKKSFQLCADDFGQDPSINEAILDLFNDSRMSTTSVLIDANPLISSINDLRIAYKQGLQVGLHFNLTHPFSNSNTPLLCKPLYQWILLSQCRLIPSDLILRSFKDQLTKFEDLLGFVPDYIDGHQHVHQFIGIGSIIIQELVRRYQTLKMPWVRNTLSPKNANHLPEKSKCNLLQYLGGNDFHTRLNIANISTNKGFLGVYNFNAPKEEIYRHFMQAWLANANDDSLIMCHPATKTIDHDAIGKQRPIEYRYLKSEDFLIDLEKYQLKIQKMDCRQTV